MKAKGLPHQYEAEDCWSWTLQLTEDVYLDTDTMFPSEAEARIDAEKWGARLGVSIEWPKEARDGS